MSPQGPAEFRQLFTAYWQPVKLQCGIGPSLETPDTLADQLGSSIDVIGLLQILFQHVARLGGSTACSANNTWGTVWELTVVARRSRGRRGDAPQLKLLTDLRMFYEHNMAGFVQKVPMPPHAPHSPPWRSAG